MMEFVKVAELGMCAMFFWVFVYVMDSKIHLLVRYGLGSVVLFIFFGLLFGMFFNLRDNLAFGMSLFCTFILMFLIFRLEKYFEKSEYEENRRRWEEEERLRKEEEERKRKEKERLRKEEEERLRKEEEERLQREEKKRRREEERNQAIHAILATSSTDRLFGYKIIRQIDFVTYSGANHEEHAKTELKHKAGRLGANGIINIKVSKEKNKINIQGDAVIIEDE